MAVSRRHTPGLERHQSGYCKKLQGVFGQHGPWEKNPRVPRYSLKELS